MQKSNNICAVSFNSGVFNSRKLIILGRAEVEMKKVLGRTVYFLGYLRRETINHSIAAPTPFIFAGGGNHYKSPAD